MPDTPPRFTATLSPATNTVALRCGIGELVCLSVIPLAVYQQRQGQWPELYPETLSTPSQND